MLEQILDDVERAFNAKAYWAGLTLALTIPDICGRAFYGNVKINERYIKWYDEYIGQYHVPPTDANQNDETDRLPLVNGLVIYKLRCALMHQGSLCLSGARENSRVKPGDIDVFEMEVSPEGLYSNMACTNRDSDGRVIKTCRVNVGEICMEITRAARRCFTENPEKFSFMEGEFIYFDPEDDFLMGS